jgi:hypothetical protein
VLEDFVDEELILGGEDFATVNPVAVPKQIQMYPSIH